MVLESEDDAARQIFENGLSVAELLLERSRQNRVLNAQALCEGPEGDRLASKQVSGNGRN
jgi:hypothetical protein